jgi:hypothetical protein
MKDDEFGYKIRISIEEYKQVVKTLENLSIPAYTPPLDALDGGNTELIVDGGLLNNKLHLKWNIPPEGWKTLEEQVLAIFDRYTSAEFFRQKERTDPDLPFVLAIADKNVKPVPPVGKKEKKITTLGFPRTCQKERQNAKISVD